MKFRIILNDAVESNDPVKVCNVQVRTKGTANGCCDDTTSRARDLYIILTAVLRVMDSKAATTMANVVIALDAAVRTEQQLQELRVAKEAEAAEDGDWQ